MQVEVVRSKKRRRTVEAQEVDGVLRVSIPAAMTRAEEAHWVDVMVKRMKRRTKTDDSELQRRADRLSKKLELPRADSIRWVDNQVQRWASCTPDDGAIRISSKVAGFPNWVLDYVIVHELAHLVEPGHDTRFWWLVNRYPMAERARGFLIAKGME
jgi:predicted metal-dependent hydrolase